MRRDGQNGPMDDAKTISLRLCRGKKISVFPVTGLKILGTVGTHFFFWKKKYVFLKDFLSGALAVLLFGGAEPFKQFSKRALWGTFM